jgi:hypothetical protein
MSLSLLITINVLAIIALLAGLAHAMSRARLLKPHVTSRQAAEQSPSAEQALATQPSWRAARAARPAATRQPASMSRRAGSHAAAAQES